MNIQRIVDSISSSESKWNGIQVDKKVDRIYEEACVFAIEKMMGFPYDGFYFLCKLGGHVMRWK